MATTTPNLVLGMSSVGDTSTKSTARFDAPEQVKDLLDAFAARGYDHLDTSRMYGASEDRMGAVSAGDRFTIDTKITSMIPGAHTRDKVLQEIDASLESLRIRTINNEYLHVPDRDTDPLEACEAMDKAFKEGKIKHWGLSNYTADEVENFVRLCEQHGYVKPSVYQGQYNAAVRSNEEKLFPVLRKHGMAFYAFSPAAGGLFARNYRNVRPGSRFDPSHGLGALYAGFYLHPCILDAVDEAAAMASKHGISGHAASLRWTAHHSALSKAHGDSVIIGVSSMEQLHSNIDAIEAGPLPEEVVTAFDAMYKATVEDMIDFVVVSHPGRPATAKTKRQAHSHAARAAHARARNLEVKRYTQQRETASNEASDDRRSSSNRHAVRGRPGVSVHVPAVVTGAFEHEPLRDFLQSLTQNEHKLFHHYITIVFPGMNASCPVLAQLSSGARNLAENWLLLSSTSTMFLRGFLLSACRHLAMAYPEAGYEHVAQQYKWTYIRALQQELAVGNGLVSVATATLAMVLVFDDVC
ncbi:NADP-dependent oxidoreductase domain-containing protein [Emericellopsis atlantica]|uniref:NADP-dependent oxidoreductase domain-containing protein n=1 Tax=Emericellopsis atlantica TaxID=2614577 RepID=A0A9P8CMF8_9HYPO|nr:NADP-dependent oxidoreductase domain-containing protein [Emericellopsis atlantica]KAG9252674.1 NADP-dependent oxidoreductase domain-containing protein [Emericellopsis atlantica]